MWTLEVQVKTIASTCGVHQLKFKGSAKSGHEKPFVQQAIHNIRP